LGGIMGKSISVAAPFVVAAMSILFAIAPAGSALAAKASIKCGGHTYTAEVTGGNCTAEKSYVNCVGNDAGTATVQCSSDGLARCDSFGSGSCSVSRHHHRITFKRTPPGGLQMTNSNPPSKGKRLLRRSSTSLLKTNPVLSTSHSHFIGLSHAGATRHMANPALGATAH
jgi:hypothetical protein